MEAFSDIETVKQALQIMEAAGYVCDRPLSEELVGTEYDLE
jgi:hypothetical protein